MKVLFFGLVVRTAAVWTAASVTTVEVRADSNDHSHLPRNSFSTFFLRHTYTHLFFFLSVERRRSTTIDRNRHTNLFGAVTRRPLVERMFQNDQ